MKSTVGRPRRITDAQVAAIMEWQRARKHKAQLAAELGLSLSAIEYALRMRGQYKQPSPELREVSHRQRKRKVGVLRKGGWI